MKNSIQISPPLMVLILAGLFALIVAFGVCWFSRANTLAHLAEQESMLRKGLITEDRMIRLPEQLEPNNAPVQAAGPRQMAGPGNN